jgi:hypothetical protein
MRTLKTPLLVQKPIYDNGLKICPIVCLLPNDKLFLQLELNNEFVDGITRQLMGIALQLQGRIQQSTLQKIGMDAILDKDYDIMLLHYQKAYKCSTETTAVGITEKAGNVINNYNDHKKTNKMIKDGTFDISLDVQLHIEDNLINFAYYGAQPFDEKETEIIKSRIAV